MPLPKEYFEQTQRQLTPSQQNRPRSIYSDIPASEFETGITGMQPDEGITGSLWDALGTAAWGYASGLTWGGTEYLDVPEAFGREPQPWEEMSGMEKAGWILGEGASLMTPYVGPFALMGKGLRVATKLGQANKFIKKSAEKATEFGVKELTKNNARLLAGKDLNAVSDTVKRAIIEQSKEDIGVQWIRNLSSTGAEANLAARQLENSSAFAVKKALQDIGMDNVDDSVIQAIGKDFTQGLAEGKYVNDVAEWIARGIAGEAPGAVRDITAKYLGMAAQDLIMMGVHGVGAGKITALANGEEFDYSGALSHSAIMALAFPAIRGLAPGGGGLDTLRTGINFYVKQFGKTNYKAIQREHGDDVVKNLLRIMVNGTRKDLLNRSTVGTASWRAGGKTYHNGEEILNALPTMSIDDTITLLQKINKSVGRSFFRDWSPKYAEDLLRSIPRMAIGTVSMNPWVLQKDAWGAMEGPELASHLFMAAIMTRSRGAWGHRDQRTYHADFTPYYEATRILGADVNSVKDMIKFADGSSILQGMGLAMETTPEGAKILSSVDNILKDSKLAGSSGKNISIPDHQKAIEFVNLYNIMKANTSGVEKAIDPLYLDKVSLDRIAKEVGDITFKNGDKINEMSYEGLLTRLTLEPANNINNHYKTMVMEIAKELNLPISMDNTGRISAYRISSSKEGKSIDEVDTVNRVLSMLEGLRPDEVSLKTDFKNYEQIVKDRGISEEQFNQEIRNIIGKYMDTLDSEYGGRRIVRDPVTENPFVEFMMQAKGVEASDRVFRIASNTAKVEGDKNLTASLDRLFQLKDGKYSESIDDYVRLLKNVNLDAKDEAGRKQRDEALLMLNDLRQVFELRNMVLTNQKGPSRNKPTREITVDELQIVHDQWQGLYRSLPMEWKADWFNTTRDAFMNRIWKNSGMDRRAIALSHFLIKEGFLIQGSDRQLRIPNLKSIIEHMKLPEAGYDKASIKAVEDAYHAIRRVLPKDNLEEMKDLTWNFHEGRPYIEGLDMTKLVQAAKLLGNETYKDLLLNTSEVLNKIKTGDSGTSLQIKDLHSKITDIIKSLDPGPDGTKPKVDPIKEINNLMAEISALEAITKSDKTKGDYNGILLELKALKEQIDTQTNKFNLRPRDMFKTKAEADAAEITDDKYGIHTAALKPIQAKLYDLFNAEKIAQMELEQTTIRLMDLAARGKSGLGLSKSETQARLDHLVTEWARLYPEAQKNGVKNLSEMIEYVNKSGHFSDMTDLMRSVNSEINRAIILKNDDHILNRMGVKAAESLEKGSKLHEHHRTFSEIANKYDLVDKDGQIKKEFKEALIRNPEKAVAEFVRESIYESDKTPDQKSRQWTEFMEKDAMEFMTMILNSKPNRTMSLKGLDNNKRAILEVNNENSGIEYNTQKYYDSQGYKDIWRLEGTVSEMIYGKLRNVDFDNTNLSPQYIQDKLENAFRTNKKMEETLKSLMIMDSELTEEQVAKIIKETPGQMFAYVRLSPKDRMVLALTPKNLKRLDSGYEKWFNDTVKRYEDRWGANSKQVKMFKRTFEHLTKEANNTRDTVELKMMMPYIDHTGKRSEFDKYIDGLSRGESIPKLAKIQANIYKRGFLSDGGTTQPINEKAIRWGAKHHPDLQYRNELKRIIKNKGYKTAVLRDDVGGEKNHPLNIDAASADNLNAKIMSTAPALLKDIARFQLENRGEIVSLDNSLLDGAKFASERYMRFIMGLKGMQGVDFIDNPNGAKTIIFSSGANQMLGKGYMIYHPEIAKHMPKDIDILIGDSSAKTYAGKNLLGSDVKAFEVSGKRKTKNWAESLQNVGAENTMIIPIDGVGVSFTSKNAKGVNIAPSIFDFQSQGTMKEAIRWMDFEGKLTNIGLEWGDLYKQGGMLANWMYETAASEGRSIDRGDAGLTKLVFEYGAQPDNPLVQKALARMLRESAYKKLSKVPNMDGGEDNFIAANIKGDLSVPVFAELWNRATGMTGRQMQDRVSINFGGININRNTAKRQLGESAGNNLLGEKFIFRDNHGVDVIVGYENGKFVYDSPFYNKYGTGQNQIKVSRQGKDEYIDFGTVDKDGKVTPYKTDSKLIKNVETILNKINTFALEHNINLNDVVNLLNGKKVVKNGNTLELGSTLANIAKGLNLNAATMSHAVPTIGYDKAIFRIEKVLDNMNGLVEVNGWDLRAILQRDLDGDHLYTHTRVPWKIFKAFANESGRKDDFRMLDREAYLNEGLIDLFGQGKGYSGKAGDSADQGMHGYANRLTQAKMAIGQIVGARNTLSWLNHTGFGLKTSSSPLMHDLIKDFKMTDQSWKVLDRFFDIVQNSVDIHGGIHQLMSDPNTLRKFIFFGELPANMADITDPLIKKHVEAGGLFRDSSFGRNELQREMFFEILRTLKKANMVTNETWDERGSRLPEPKELKDAFYDITNFFKSPTSYLATKMGKVVNRKQGMEKERLAQEFIEYFYEGSYSLTREGDRKALLKSLSEMDFKAISPKFNFKNIANAQEGFDSSISGHLLSKLATKDYNWEPNFDSQQPRASDTKMFDKAGHFIRNMENYIETARMLGVDEAQTISDIADLSVKSFGNKGIDKIITDSVNKGILKELIHREYNNVMQDVEYLRKENFSNPTKLDKQIDRLANLQLAMEVMDKQIAKEIVLDKSKDLRFMSNKTEEFTQKANLGKIQGEVAIYRIRSKNIPKLAKDIKPDQPTHRLSDYEANGMAIDYGMLEYVGRYNKFGSTTPGKNKGRDLMMEKGWQYIVDSKPKQRVNLGATEVKYSRALFKATYGEDMVAQSFMKEGVDSFLEDTRSLRAKISYDHIKTVKDAMSNRVLSDNLYNMNTIERTRLINQYVSRWKDKVDPGKGNNEIDILLRYLLQPQMVPTYYYTDGQTQMPAFKTNQFLYKSVLKWAEDNGQSAFVKNLVYDVEQYASGRKLDFDLGPWKRANVERYNMKALGDAANSAKTLTKHLNKFFATPLFSQHFFEKDIKPVYRGRSYEAMASDGGKVTVSRTPKKGSYWNIQNSKGGRGCP